MGVAQYSLVANDWLNLEFIINDLTQRVVGQELHPTSDPTFADLSLTGSLDLTGDLDITGNLDIGGTTTFNGLTASRIVGTNASKELVSLASPLIVSEGGTGLATITDHGILLGSGTGAITPLGVAANGKIPIGSAGADPVLAEITGTANQVNVSNGAGSITLSTPQDIAQSSSPTFAGLHINSPAVTSTTLLTLESDINNTNEYNEILFKVVGGQNYGAIRSYIGGTAGDSYMSLFTTTNGGTLVRQVTVQHDGRVGFGTYNPETLVTMVSAAPYLTLYNNTEEDTTGGGESRIIGKREDGAGTPTETGTITMSHDGAGVNDQLAKMVLGVNTGSGVVDVLTIDSGRTVTLAQDLVMSGTTAIGLDMSDGTFATALQKWPAGTIQSTGDIVYQPMSDGTTRYQWLDQDGGTPIVTIDTTNERTSFGLSGAAESPVHVGPGTDANYGVLTVSGPNGSFFRLNSDNHDNYKIHNDFGNLYCSNNTDARFDWIIKSTGHLFFGTDGKSTKFGGGLLSGNAVDLVEFEHATPNIIQHSTTHSNANGATAGKHVWRREDGDGTETEAGQIEVSHDGAGVNDQLAKMVFGVNTGSGVVDVIEIDSSANTKIGDLAGVNQTVIEADGTIRFDGAATVWNDLVLPLSSARVPAANAPSWTSFIGNLNNYTYGLNDFQEFSTELEHGYKGGSTFEFHVHGATNGSNVDDRTIKVEIEYTVADTPAETGLGDVYPATTTINGEITIPADTTDRTAFSIDIGTDSGGSFVQGAIINGRVRRIASTGTEPTGDPFLTEVGIHVEDDTIGTRTETTK